MYKRQEYGIDEELFLPDEDKEMITKFIVENFPNGYTMSAVSYTHLRKRT